MALIQLTPAGLYCQAGDFYIDPHRPVRRALITHAHSDHARIGMGQYIAHHHTLPVLQHRLGHALSTVGLNYGEVRTIRGLRISFHPAGHVPGSAQIKIESKGEIWVVSGDYHTLPDNYCAPFEPQKCHTFITESTFANPIFHWPSDEELWGEMNLWIDSNQQAGRASLFLCYSFGKAQRLLFLLKQRREVMYVHPTISALNQALGDILPGLPTTVEFPVPRHFAPGNAPIILAPPGSLRQSWIKSMPPFQSAYLSGWMQHPKRKFQIGADTGFALSDHADWSGLWQAVRATGASCIYTHHGYADDFSIALRHEGFDAHSFTHTPSLFS
jgi:putative mRNA 3-end processing factor